MSAEKAAEAGQGGVFPSSSSSSSPPSPTPTTSKGDTKVLATDNSAAASDTTEPPPATSAAADLVAATPKRSWKSYVWDTLDKEPEERRFLFKLDAVVLTMASLGYFIKYLDQVNIGNAFVSGMQEDLGLYGNELNYMITVWTVGYVLGEIPSNMLLTRIRPSVWIPACEVVWSALTILLAKCTSARQIYVLRFFIGLAESTFYPGMQYVIGSWYRGDELAKRSCIFHASGAIGQMFSGYLMAASHNLDGRGGFRGWQWLFIVNTVISLPIAFAGFFMFPDVPEITRAWWLTEDQRALAQRRMQLEGRAGRTDHNKDNNGDGSGGGKKGEKGGWFGSGYDGAKLAKIFRGWPVYLLTLLYILFNNGNNFGSQPAFAQWLKDEGYAVEAYNTYPTINAAIGIVFTLIYAWTSDSLFRGARWPPIVFSGAAKILLYTGLAVWDIPTGLKWACFLLESVGSGISGLTFAWAHEICSGDNEERALVVASMNEMAYVFQAWLPLLIWPQVESPVFFKGMVTMVVFAALLIAVAFVIRHLHHRDRDLRRARAAAGGGEPRPTRSSSDSSKAVAPRAGEP